MHDGLAYIFKICLPLTLNKTFLCQEFYTNDPKTFTDYGRIINQRHFKRITGLMEGSTVAIGGRHDESQRYIGEQIYIYIIVEKLVTFNKTLQYAQH